MCGQMLFEVRDNVATFTGTIETCCLDRIGIPQFDPQVLQKVRDYATFVVTRYLKLVRYETGEGNVLVRPYPMRYRPYDAGYRVQATIHAHGPDSDLRLYAWGMSAKDPWGEVAIRRSASE